MLVECQQNKGRFFCSFGHLWNICRLKVSMVWLPVYTFTSPWNLRIAFLHLTHAFSGCVSLHIHLWLSCKIALRLSLKNTLDAVLVPGEYICYLCRSGFDCTWKHRCSALYSFRIIPSVLELDNVRGFSGSVSRINSGLECHWSSVKCLYWGRVLIKQD